MENHNIEYMSATEICEWLKSKSGKHFEDSILSAIIGKVKFAGLFKLTIYIYIYS